MTKNTHIVIFDGLKNEDDTVEDTRNKLPSHYLFNEILKNSTATIPVIRSFSDEEKCEHVILVVPLSLIESEEEIIPSYWEAYIYWQYPSVRFGINSSGFRKVMIRMFRWFMKMEKMPYVVITGFKDEDDTPRLSRIDIISCLASNGLPNDRIFFINDGRCDRDVLIIEELVKTVERDIFRKLIYR